jgi:membrane-associated phospholipid phosphatase
VFYLWPNAVPPAHIAWDRYPGMAFLKGVDAAGNACPSLHVATAVFAGFWLHWMLPILQLGTRARCLNVAWCAAIAYSTMATKQHVAIDVMAGALAGAAMALALQPRPLPAFRQPA